MRALAICEDYWQRLGTTAELPEGAPRWPTSGIAIEGDFAGIQGFVLKPVPGSKGAAKRLRARSYRVTAISRQVADTICRAFATADPRIYFLAGGHVLVFCNPVDGWEDRLEKVQVEIDQQLFWQFSGEVAFNMAGAEFADGRIPVAPLRRAMEVSRARPNAGALLSGQTWDQTALVALAHSGWFKCLACLRTVYQDSASLDEEGDVICHDCAEDIHLGSDLARGGGKRVPKEKLQGILRWHPVRADHSPMTFEDIAACSRGERKFLGYLRLDVDHAGLRFRELDGAPAKIWLLSHFLDVFFSRHVQALMASEFTTLYPVYGGGDDLFVVGPWDGALRFLARLIEDFRKITNGALTFSAGMALAKPHAHILTAGNLAAEALAEAKDSGRDCVRALGTLIPAEQFPSALRQAALIRDWVEDGHLTSAFLQNLRTLWAQAYAADTPNRRPMHEAILHYQIERNLSRKSPPEVLKWARSLRQSHSDFKYIPFLAGGALLARRNQGGRDARHE